MIRSVVTVLVGLQLLMPPGMCVCRFAPVAAVGTDANAVRPAPPPLRACCASCGSRHPAAESCPDQAPAAPDHPIDRGPPDHLPGCPAVSPDVAAKLPAPTEPPVDAAADALAAAVAAGITGEPAAACRTVPHAAFPSDPPLYLSFLVLLI